MFAVYRPELSYQPGVDIAKMRYFAVTTVRVRPGHEDNYADYVRNVQNAARGKVKAEAHFAVYQVIAGMPGTTFLVFRPMKSLAEYDMRLGPKVRAAMTDDERKKADKITSEGVIVTDTSVYAFNPSMSYLPTQFTARDAAFWNPTPEPVAKPRATKRKKPTTTAAVQ